MWRKPGIYQRLAALAGPPSGPDLPELSLGVGLGIGAPFEPHTSGSPVAAVTELKKLNLARVFNDYDFGFYRISRRCACIDGRTELCGEKFFVDDNVVSGLMKPEKTFRLRDEYNIEVTLMRTQSAATKLLDHIDGRRKIYSDDIATIHLRKACAVHTGELAVDRESEVIFLHSQFFLDSQ